MVGGCSWVVPDFTGLGVHASYFELELCKVVSLLLIHALLLTSCLLPAQWKAGRTFACVGQ